MKKNCIIIISAILFTSLISFEETTAAAETTAAQIKPRSSDDTDTGDGNNGNQILSDLLAAFASTKILAIGPVGNQSSLMVVTNEGTADKSMVYQVWPSDDADGSDTGNASKQWNLWNASALSLRARWPGLVAAVPDLDTCLAWALKWKVQGTLLLESQTTTTTTTKLMIVCSRNFDPDSSQPMMLVHQLDVATGQLDSSVQVKYLLPYEINIGLRIGLMPSESTTNQHQQHDYYCLQTQDNLTGLYPLQLQLSPEDNNNSFTSNTSGFLCDDGGSGSGSSLSVSFTYNIPDCSSLTTFGWANGGFATTTTSSPAQKKRLLFIFDTENLYTLPLDASGDGGGGGIPMPVPNITIPVTTIPLNGGYFTVKSPSLITNANTTTEKSANSTSATKAHGHQHDSTTTKGGGSLSLIVILAPVVGVVCLLLAVLGAFLYYFCCYTKRRMKSTANTDASEDNNSSVNNHKDKDKGGKSKDANKMGGGGAKTTTKPMVNNNNKSKPARTSKGKDLKPSDKVKKKLKVITTSVKNSNKQNNVKSKVKGQASSTSKSQAKQSIVSSVSKA